MQAWGIVILVVCSLFGLNFLLMAIRQITMMILEAKARKEIKNITNEIFKNIDNDMKKLKRAEFFEDLDKIKKENEEEK